MVYRTSILGVARVLVVVRKGCMSGMEVDFVREDEVARKERATSHNKRS